MRKSGLNPAKVDQQRPKPRPQATRCLGGAALFTAPAAKGGGRDPKRTRTRRRATAGETTANEIAQAARARHGPLHPGPAPRRGTHGEAHRWAGSSGAASGRWESIVALLEVAHAARTLCWGTWRIWKVRVGLSRLIWLFSRLWPALLPRRSWVGGPASAPELSVSSSCRASCQPCLLALAPRLRARTREALEMS